MTNYSISSDGKIDVAMSLDADPSLPEMIRVGMTMGVPMNLEQTEYFGRGPWENYSDRKRSADVGVYKSSTSDMYHSYAMPQENGNHCDVRWLTLRSANGSEGIRVSAPSRFDFSAWPFSADAIEAAKHPFELVPQGFFTLSIHGVQTGVGGTLSHTLPQYVVPAGSYRLQFQLSAAGNDR